MEYQRSQSSRFCADELEIEARSMLAFSLLLGKHFMAAEHGPLSRAEVPDSAAQRILAWRNGSAARSGIGK